LPSEKAASVFDCFNQPNQKELQMNGQSALPQKSFLAEFQRQRLIPGLVAGLTCGVIDLIVSISLAALIFNGDLSGFVPKAIGLILLGGIIAVIVTGLFSSFPGTVSSTQDAPAAILAVSAAAIVGTLASTTSPQVKFMTVVGAIALTSALTGLFFILLGQFKLGALVRFLPYPVVGGFLAGTGWLLVTGGIGVMADVPFSFAHLSGLFQAVVWQHWLPGLVLALIMLLVLNRYSHFMLLPGMLLAVAALFYGFVWISHTPLAEVSAHGWLLGSATNGSLWQPLRLSDLTLVRWSAVFGQAGNLASVLLVSVVALLLNTSGIELVIKQDLDINRELRSAGLGSLLSGLVGGIVCFHALTNTTLNYRTSQGSRIASWVTAGFCAVALFYGPILLSFIPKIMLGSLLILLGLSFLYEWVYQAWLKFSKVEYCVILVILVVIAIAGYLQGVGVGILAAVGLFVIDYSRVDVVKHALSGLEYQSQVTRGVALRKVLLEHGDETYILQLQGFIFFGTANNLLERVRQRISQVQVSPLRFLILDFLQVSGLDSTALLSFSKIKQISKENAITLLVTSPSNQVKQQLEKGNFISQGNEGARLFMDLDHGLEWCEDQTLISAGIPSGESAPPLQEQFQELLPGSTRLANLFNYLEKQETEAGEYLMHQGDPADYLYFVEDGQVTAQLDQAGKEPLRLETMHAGRVVGEIGFYLGQQRTAAVVSDTPSIVYRLSADRLEQMERREPETASTFHRIIIHLLAERATHLIRTVRALKR
jgi:SulP family sulfate permease